MRIWYGKKLPEEKTGLSKNNAYAEFHKAGAPVVIIGKTR